MPQDLTLRPLMANDLSQLLASPSACQRLPQFMCSLDYSSSLAWIFTAYSIFHFNVTQVLQKTTGSTWKSITLPSLFFFPIFSTQETVPAASQSLGQKPEGILDSPFSLCSQSTTQIFLIPPPKYISNLTAAFFPPALPFYLPKMPSVLGWWL